MSASRRRDPKGLFSGGGAGGRGRVLPERLMLPSTSSAKRSAKRRDSQVLVAAVKGEMGEEPDSPSSPPGRIAKRNARALNELKTSDLSEKCPIVQSLLGMEDVDELGSDDLISLQHQLESLLAENVDNQKMLHGEITYLNTGDYPKLDVSNRPMPSYTLLERSPSSSTSAQHDSSRPGCSYHRHDDSKLNLADLGLNSSHEEDGPEPSILDVPRRFWRWSREYLKDIGEDYVREFREKLVERFSREAIQKWLIDETPSTSKPSQRSRIPKVILKRSGLRRESYESQKDTSTSANISNGTLPTLSPHSPSAETPKSRRSRAVKRKAPEEGPVAKSINSPKLLAIVERMLESVSAEQLSSPAKPVRGLSNGYGVRECEVAVEEMDPAHLLQLMNGGGAGGAIVGTSTRSQRAKQNALLLNGFQPLLRASNIDPLTDDDNSNLSPPPILSPVPAPSTAEKLTKRLKLDPKQLQEVKQGIISIGVRKGLLPAHLDPSTSAITMNGGCSYAPALNGLITPKAEPAVLNTSNNHDHPSDGDEVSAELRLKQAELSALHKKTLPLIETIFDRVEAEHIMQELAHQLDAADDKVLLTIAGSGVKGKNYSYAINRDPTQKADWETLMTEREKAIAKLYPYISRSHTGHSKDAQRQSKIGGGDDEIVNGGCAKRGKRR